MPRKSGNVAGGRYLGVASLHPALCGACLLTGVLAASVLLATGWLNFSIGDRCPWLGRAALLGLPLVWIYGGLALCPQRLPLLRRIVLAGVLLVLAALLLQMAVIDPMASARARVAGNLSDNAAVLEQALEIHASGDGGRLVVVPWIRIREEAGERQLVELRWLDPDPARRSIFLARTTADGRLVRDGRFREMAPQLEACFESPEHLEDLLDRMAEGWFEDRGAL
ncbi:MAG: hypothetical protein EA425_05065 [Puniceicoccaceae bacterium]|nr:MAG: hypothetical protein EA425_05065 [Puniceicoccaceae bacterium]